MALFETSTQRKHWLLSGEELHRRRGKARQASLDRIREMAPSLEAEALTAEQEELLRVYHERRVVRLLKSNRLPTKTAATAVTYFKRFYVDRDLMEHNPNVIAFSAMYAAIKVEETLRMHDRIIDAEVLQVELEQDSDPVASTVPAANTILDTELSFFEALDFELVCFHPYRSLDALVARLVDQFGERDDIYAAANVAKQILTTRASFSDLQLTYAPAQIALGALQEAFQSTKLEDVDSERNAEDWNSSPPPRVSAFIAHICEVQGAGAEQRDRVLAQVHEVVAVLKATSKLIDRSKDIKLVTEIERRRRRCSNPKLDPESEVYKEEERAAARKREKQQAKKARREELAARRERAELTGIKLPDDDDDDGAFEDDEDEDEDLEDRGAHEPKRQRMSIA